MNPYYQILFYLIENKLSEVQVEDLANELYGKIFNRDSARPLDQRLNEVGAKYPNSGSIHTEVGTLRTIDGEVEYA